MEALSKPGRLLSITNKESEEFAKFAICAAKVSTGILLGLDDAHTLCKTFRCLSREKGILQDLKNFKQENNVLSFAFKIKLEFNLANGLEEAEMPALVL